jgi:hypothetical protein
MLREQAGYGFLQATPCRYCGRSTVGDRRYCGLAIAALAAIARPTVIHRAILAALPARRLICRQRSRANQCRENRKQNFGVVLHTRFNPLKELKLCRCFTG